MQINLTKYNVDEGVNLNVAGFSSVLLIVNTQYASSDQI